MAYPRVARIEGQPFNVDETVISLRKDISNITNRKDFGKHVVVAKVWATNRCGSGWGVIIKGEEKFKNNDGKQRVWDSAWFKRVGGD